MSKVVQTIVGIAAIVVGAYFDQPWLIGLGANILLSEAADSLLSPTAVKVKATQDLSGLVQNTDLNSRVIYGETRVGGLLSYLGTTGTDNNDLDYVVAHCYTHETGVESMTDVWIDGNLIADADIDSSGNVTAGNYAGLVEIHRYTGDSSQAVDSELTAYTDWADTAIGKGVCYTHVRCLKTDDDTKFKTAFPNGAPQTIEVLIQGEKVYDPRQDSTAGGSGSQRVDDPTTWAYSANPALCLRDYLTRSPKDGGVGWDASTIDAAYLAAAATVCDGSVTVPNGSGGTTTQARYLCNGVIVAGASYQSEVQAFTVAMAGALVQAGGKFRIYAGAYSSPVYTITEDDLAGDPQVATPDRSSRYNYITASFRDKDNAYQSNEAQPFQDSAYETADGGRLEKHLDMPLTSGNYDAQIVMRVLGVRSRYQRTFKLPMNGHGMVFNVWDVVNVNLAELGGTDIACRVISVQYGPDMGPQVVLREENVAIYTWDGSAAVEPPVGDGGGDFFQKPAAPASPSATATSDGIELQWTNPPVGTYYQIYVYRSTTSGGTYTNIGRTMADHFRDPLTDGQTRYYKLKAWNGYQDSDFSTEVSATAKTITPGLRHITAALLAIDSACPVPPVLETGSSGFLHYLRFASGVTDQGSESYSFDGPSYSDLDPGLYRVTAILRVNDNSADGVAGTFSTATGSTDGPTFDLRWSDFQATDAWQSFSWDMVALPDDYRADGYEIRFDWQDNGPASGTLDMLTFIIEPVGQSTINSSDGGHTWRGSVPPTLAGGFTYTSTGTTITWAWSSLVIYWPDDTTTSIPDGSQEFTGLTASTTYRFYPYWDLADHSVKWAGGANAGASFTSAQTQCRYDHTPLSQGGLSAATTSSGGSGSGSGGGSACLHQDEPLGIRTGTIRAAAACPGDEVHTRDGWSKIIAVSKEPHRVWQAVTLGASGRTYLWTPEQPVRMWDDRMLAASDLKIGSLVRIQGGAALPVVKLERIVKEGAKIILSIDSPHWYYQHPGGPEVHNGTVKP